MRLSVAQLTTPAAQRGSTSSTKRGRSLATGSIRPAPGLTTPAGPVALIAPVDPFVAEAADAASDARLRTFLAEVDIGALMLDPAGCVLFINDHLLALLGRSRAEMVGQDWIDIAVPVVERAALRKLLFQGIAVGTMSGHREDGLVTALGDERRLSWTSVVLRDAQGDVAGTASIGHDVTEVYRVEADRSLLAADLILEAAVRTLLGEAIQAASTSSNLEDAAQAVCDGLASLPGIGVVHLVAFLGEDDTLVVASGQPVGSPVTPELTSVTAARGAQLRTWAEMGPWGEGSLSTAEVAQMDEAMRAAGMLGLAFGPIRHGGHVEGVLIVGTRESRFAAIVSEKMPALVGFGASANTLLVDRLHERSREFDLRRVFDTVLAARAFRPVFQPIVDLTTGETVGYEALTRFDSGERPDTCFADAWSVSMGVELELATLESAITAARDLPAGRWLDLNVSPRLFAAADRLETLVGSADRPVVVEITEHDLIDDYAAVRAAAAALGSGVRLAVDDAGVGVANFGHIIELRPDFVKLDMSLVRRVNVDLGRQALVVAMRHFARTAGCRLIAEGIETDEEARALRQLGVEFGQGYWFGRPQSAEHWASGNLARELHRPGD